MICALIPSDGIAGPSWAVACGAEYFSLWTVTSLPLLPLSLALGKPSLSGFTSTTLPGQVLVALFLELGPLGMGGIFPENENFLCFQKVAWGHRVGLTLPNSKSVLHSSDRLKAASEFFDIFLLQDEFPVLWWVFPTQVGQLFYAYCMNLEPYITILFIVFPRGFKGLKHVHISFNFISTTTSYWAPIMSHALC